MAKLKIETIKQPNKIINYWKKEKFVVACIIIFGLTFNSAAVLSPIYQGKLIDSIVRGDSLASVLSLSAVFVCLIGMIQLLRYFKRFYIRRFQTAPVLR
jgi:ABC-type bacteriocin/lantibiotic exporter with double-glycine peptidase domain